MHQLRAFLFAAPIVALLACEREPQVAQTGQEVPALSAARPAAAAEPQVTNAILWQAVTKGESATVAAGLSQGLDANLMTSEGVTALMLAASTGNDRTASALLGAGARPNDLTTKDRLTPLMFAAYGCSRPVVDLLIAAQADAKLKDSAGGSAADWAFRGCKNPDEAASLMEYLYKNGASVQPRGDALGLFLAEGTRPPIDAVLEAARSTLPIP